MKKIKLWHIILTLIICPVIVGTILKYLPSADKPEGDYIGGDKLEAKIQDSSGDVRINLQGSNLKRSPIITNSSNIHVDNSVTINKILPEIKIGAITDINITGISPYKYSFVFRYSITMDTPASYEVEYINLALYEIIEKEDGLDKNIFLFSTRVEESFKSFGMLRKAPKRNINFTYNKRIKDLKIKLVMGLEGGLTKEDFRNIWKFGGNKGSN